MAIASSIDVVLENDDIVVLGPPTSIDIAVDIGPQGPRGSRTFTGGVDPNTYSSAQFETIYGYVPVYGDIFIRTSSGSDYGIFYMYNTLAPGGPIWQQTLKIYDLLTDFFTLNDTFVLSGKNGGTGAANTGKSLLLGGPQTIFNGNYTVTISSTGNTNITLPTSGTLATTGNLSQFASTTSAQLAGIISDETGSGLLVFNNSPTLTGTPLSTTAAADTNTTQLATTAFVIGQAGSASPLMDNTATVGTSLRYARQDHIHPTDTSRAPLESPTFTGTVNLPTVSITGVATTSSYINRTTANGNSSWLQQDGTGRVHWYWNTLGGTSPTFTNAAEDASALTLHVNNNGNGGTFFHRSANGASASAGGPITWTTTLYVDLATITYKGNRIPTVADKLNAFTATTSAELAGVISDETGSGSLVFATSPSLTTPNIGAATGTSLSVTGNITVSTGNTTGGGIILADDGDMVDMNNGYLSLRFSNGVQIYSGNKTGSAVITLANSGNLTTTGSVITPASTTSLSPLRIPHGSDPTAPTNGDIWTTTSGMYVRINGSTIGPLGTGGGGGGGGTTNTEDVIGISFFTMGA